jgi:hypothetical protein
MAHPGLGRGSAPVVGKGVACAREVVSCSLAFPSGGEFHFTSPGIPCILPSASLPSLGSLCQCTFSTAYLCVCSQVIKEALPTRAAETWAERGASSAACGGR